VGESYRDRNAWCSGPARLLQKFYWSVRNSRSPLFSKVIVQESSGECGRLSFLDVIEESSRTGDAHVDSRSGGYSCSKVRHVS